MPVHADWQQTPCSQNAERHSFLLRQTAPFGLRPQDPFTHTAGNWHWLSAVHDGRHAFAPHVKGKQGFAAGRHALPGAVAGRQRVSPSSPPGTRARHAVPDAVALASARLAPSVRAAARRRPHRRRWPADRSSRGDVHAVAHHGGDARFARAGARLVAADALRAEVALALVGAPSTSRHGLLAARVTAQVFGVRHCALVRAGVEAARTIADVGAHGSDPARRTARWRCTSTGPCRCWRRRSRRRTACRPA